MRDHVPLSGNGLHTATPLGDQIPSSGRGLKLATPPSGRQEQADFLTTLDWSEGDVRTNSRAVVEELMKKSLSEAQLSRRDPKKRSHDPLVTMDMRHKAVKERRRARERERAQALRAQAAKREARREAEKTVRREEEAQRRREVREEQMVKEQMAVVRKQLKEERDRQRWAVNQSLQKGLRLESKLLALPPAGYWRLTCPRWVEPAAWPHPLCWTPLITRW